MREKQVWVDDMPYVVPEQETYEGLFWRSKKEDSATAMLAIVGHDLQELGSVVREGSHVRFLTYAHPDGHRVYSRSLSMLMLKAARDLWGSVPVVIEHSINSNYYCELHKAGLPVTEEMLSALKKRMKELVEADLPIQKETMDIDRAMEIARSQGMETKARLFRYRKASNINMYCLEGFYDYFYGYMLPRTGYLKAFDLALYERGFLLIFPDKNNPGAFLDYHNRNKISQVFMEQLDWSRLMGVDNVADLNDTVVNGTFGDLVLVNEALHEKKIAQIADTICNKSKQGKLKMVLIAGPSSSGKTSFAQRLSIQLRVNGMIPHTIGLDDYFVNRSNTPLDSEGKPDFESIDALDLETFNRDLNDLIAGKQVEMPSYNFVLGQREYKGRYLQLKEEDILVIEGIHGLNERLTSHIPAENKYRIFISAMTQLNVDDHNRISTSDSRLIRRIVRDYQFRGNSAAKTIATWPSVKRGEERNIFPYQENADVMFNSATIYELSVLKNYIEPLLYQIQPDQEEYATAKRIIKFLDYFLAVNCDVVPKNSILKEFVGGSVLKV